MLDHNENPEQNQAPAGPGQKLSKSQKIAALFLAFFALALIIIWPLQFKNSLNQPFQYQGEGGAADNQANNTTKDPEEEAKNKDTDGDGLTDWDELNIHKTSPYLEDSDSDGYPDGQEVGSGNDPNCPTGRDCYGLNSDEQAVIENNDQQIRPDPETPNTNVGPQETGQAQNDDVLQLQMLLEGKIEPSELRRILIENGVDRALVDNFSDEELKEMYQETIGVSSN